MKPTPAALLLVASLLAAAALPAMGDVYMHRPRGSNNRNCEKNENRANGQRLFDSQNNDAGGYACPRAEPFACYRLEGDDAAKAACNNQNQNNENKNMVSDKVPHNLVVGPETNLNQYTPMERMYYVEGSTMAIEWTAQHGCGTNDKVNCDIVIQVACEDTENLGTESWRTTLTDDCGTGATGQSRCTPRDGTPVQNSQDNVNGRNTATIPFNVEQQDDYRYGRHEGYRYYQDCKRRARNGGLFLADQKLNPRNVNHDATFSRQNPNGDNDNNKNGLECPEESEYYPYWHPTPWMDVAVITNNVNRCFLFQNNSQNVRAKNYCECNNQDCGSGTQANPGGNRGQLPNNERECNEKNSGVWKSVEPFNIPKPECIVGQFSRDNHLGNVGGEGQTASYNWTIPNWLVGKESCTLRLRYNMSSTDFESVAVNGDSTLNGEKSPLVDREDKNNNNGGREAESYMPILGMAETEELGGNDGDYRLGFAVNTDQYARTFQDRSYMFSVKPRTREFAGACEGVHTKIHNLGVRGKRGNIVQVYPSVEYDFVPNKLTVMDHDCLHIQWTGSDYNPNRNPNNGEGGPPDPQNNNAARADRSNLVQMNISGNNYIDFDASNYLMLDTDVQAWRDLAFIKQDVTDDNKCQSIENIIQNGPKDRQARERYFKNCMKLSGAPSPYFNLGVVRAGKPGEYRYMSTRNNNFSNRGQKGKLTILKGIGGGTGRAGGGSAPADPSAQKSPGSAKSQAKRNPGGGGAEIPKHEACKFITDEYLCNAQSDPDDGDCEWDDGECKTNKTSTATILIAVFVTLGVLGLAGFFGLQAYRKHGLHLPYQSHQHKEALPTKEATIVVGNGTGVNGTSKNTATALYDHKAKEDGELEFKKGDRISIVKKDPSGWWEGTNPRTQKTGVFPANYVQV